MRVTLIVGLVLVAGLGIAAEYVARNAGPVLQRSVVETLEQRLHEPVSLDRLEISAVRGLEVRAYGLRVMPAPGTAVPDTPVIAARQITFHTSLWSLLRLRDHIDTAHVEGLELHIPPHSMGRAMKGSSPGGAGPRPAVKLTVDRIECADALLVIDTDKPGKLPLQFVIHHLTLTSVGGPQPLLYQADLINPKPTGALHVTGNFGPWHGEEPRATPITGQYVLRDADLGTIKGVRGTLQSAGTFGGALESIKVDGSTQTPDFGLDVSAHTLPLETQFHAIVDGTSGDTTLAPVQALLGHSAFTAQGTIQRIRQGGADGGPGISLGHDIALNVTMPHGRIEDLLMLAMDQPKPMMRGTVAMTNTKVHIPPGPVRVLQKLEIAGDVRIVGVEFTNPVVQDKLDGLSLRAQGRPQDVKTASHDGKPEVASDMDVRFTLGDSMLKVASLDYNLPGANVHLVGVYALGSEAYRFEGQVRTDAKASEMVTGWKSALLKPFNGLLAKNGAGVQLPLSITGVKNDFKFGLHDSRESPEQMAAEMRNSKE